MAENASKLPLIQTLPDQVYEIIKQRVVTHQLRPGQALVEKQLAAELGVSTTPIREALLRLEYEALVTKTPYAGARVADISSKDVRDIFEDRGSGRVVRPFIFPLLLVYLVFLVTDIAEARFGLLSLIRRYGAAAVRRAARVPWLEGARRASGYRSRYRARSA